MELHHDSRDAWFRWPGGALACGQSTRLRLKAICDAPPEAVTLRLWAHEAERRLPMALLGAIDGGWLYEATLPAGNVPGTIWYRFEADYDGQRTLYGNAADGLGGVGQQGNSESYQLTVYDPAFAPPAWLREGVIYQIMTDRFFNGAPTGRLLHARQDITRHEDWYEAPTLAIAENGDNFAHDFFGGNLPGVRQKLPYLKSLGVTVLYLNPIFQAASNHKYDTGDYSRIDPMFGTEADFTALCRDAEALGMRVMLDGVFSHVGADSRYFNRYGHYDGVGAYQSQSSPYYSWFSFRRFPDDYASWWGFDTLPEVRKLEPSYVDYMLTGQQAIVPHWLQAGASAWRLDVADELPMAFLRTLRQAAKAARPDAVVLGEVWEDASNKVAYGEMRNYTLGDTLDSVMNYPLREMLIDFLLGRQSAGQVQRRLLALAENYPKPFFYSLMNLLGSHDRARILNVLAERTGEDLPRPKRRTLKLTAAQKKLGAQRVRLMLALIAALPGVPCVYYGDEAGLQGAPDPFCRAAYPWGKEDAAQVAYFTETLQRRHAQPVLSAGEMTLLAPTDDVLLVLRYMHSGHDAFGQPAENAIAICAVNRSTQPRPVFLPGVLPNGGDLQLTLPPLSATWPLDKQ